ncbi:hypothetical protein [Sphingomonas sp. NIBR02145]|uniref:hypothetical protein n=1 Tax=Sphingomonas sp. NIBR02145 TaxID=3014784 RepID=UPI0022B3F666|nr:hypothetical protein [Sphingomonas sp. NIBR02145]WHU02745.1 hypothetical protein O3305_21625 [Sphingomonas sp. NIBR02145]
MGKAAHPVALIRPGVSPADLFAAIYDDPVTGCADEEGVALELGFNVAPAVRLSLVEYKRDRWARLLGRRRQQQKWRD